MPDAVVVTPLRKPVRHAGSHVRSDSQFDNRQATLQLIVGFRFTLQPLDVSKLAPWGQ
jgi:hypothetical protein